MANVEKMIAETFLEMAQGLESGSYGKRPKIALTGMGSEHGEENASFKIGYKKLSVFPDPVPVVIIALRPEQICLILSS